MSAGQTRHLSRPANGPENTDGALGGPGAIRVRGISRRFGDNQALAPLDLDIGPGAVTGLVGPNGSGKSTFLRILVGLVRPDTGEASIDGARLVGDGTAIRKRCTLCPGEISLYGEMRGGEHLDWLLRGREREARTRARQTAADLDLPLRRPVRAFSHGMKRQLLFAAAMAPRVAVRLLDEPTEGLDPTRRSTVLNLLHEEAATGTCILFSSHHLSEVERVCGRILFLDRGRLIADETPSELRDRTRRLLRLSWREEGPADLEAELRAALGTPPLGEVVVRGGEASILLESQDPRAFLARLESRPALASPETIEYGRLSLKELYRELYGAEGI